MSKNFVLHICATSTVDELKVMNHIMTFQLTTIQPCNLPELEKEEKLLDVLLEVVVEVVTAVVSTSTI